MCATVAVSASRVRAPAAPLRMSTRSFPPARVSRTVRAPPGTTSVDSSVCAARSTRLGGNSATPCETIVRAKSTGSPPAPTSGISATSGKAANAFCSSFVHAVFADGVEPPLTNSLQLAEAAVFERDLRARDEVPDGARNEDLAGLRLRRNAGADRNRDPARLLSHQLALSRVQTGTDLESERANVPYQRAGTLDRAARAI